MPFHGGFTSGLNRLNFRRFKFLYKDYQSINLIDVIKENKMLGEWQKILKKNNPKQIKQFFKKLKSLPKCATIKNMRGKNLFIKKGNDQDVELEAEISDYFSNIQSIRTVYYNDNDPLKMMVLSLNNTPPLRVMRYPLGGSVLTLKQLNWTDLESLITQALGRTFPEHIDKYLESYVIQIAKVNAHGPLFFLNANNSLVSKKGYYNRFSRLVNKQKQKSIKNLDRILSSYEVIANTIGNSKIKTFVKDARLKNALYNARFSNEVSIIDFDPKHLRLAPPQHDLSKILLFSVGNRKKLLDTYVEVYNSDVKIYNQKYNGDNKETFYHGQLYGEYDKRHSKPGIKQEIKDKKEFEFVFLNSIVDYALFCTVEQKYNPSSKFHKYQIKNAVYAIDELKNNWQNKYTEKDLKNLDYIKTFLSKGI